MKFRVFLLALVVALVGAASATAQLRSGTVELNGFEILNTNIAKVREHPMDGKEHHGASRTDGHFGLLGHQDPVAFRNIRIKRLTSN